MVGLDVCSRLLVLASLSLCLLPLAQGTIRPTNAPLARPSLRPSVAPSSLPLVPLAATSAPSIGSSQPPSTYPTQPTALPSLPSQIPAIAPSITPSSSPTSSPRPTVQPSTPTSRPSTIFISTRASDGSSGALNQFNLPGNCNSSSILISLIADWYSGGNVSEQSFYLPVRCIARRLRNL